MCARRDERGREGQRGVQVANASEDPFRAHAILSFFLFFSLYLHLLHCTALSRPISRRSGRDPHYHHPHSLIIGTFHQHSNSFSVELSGRPLGLVAPLVALPWASLELTHAFCRTGLATGLTPLARRLSLFTTKTLPLCNSGTCLQLLVPCSCTSFTRALLTALAGYIRIAASQGNFLAGS